MRFDREALAHGTHLDDKMRNAKLLRKFASARASASLVYVCSYCVPNVFLIDDKMRNAKTAA